MSDQWTRVRSLAAETRLLVDSRLTGLELVRAAIGQKNLTLLERPSGHPVLRGAQGVCDETFILVDRSLAPEDKAWVLAHELGHALLHSSQHSCSHEEMDISATSPPLHFGAGNVDDYHPKKLIEQAANIFAAAFLMPIEWLLDLFRSGKSVAEIATAAGVTELAALHVLAGTLTYSTTASHHTRDMVETPDPNPSQDAASSVSSGPVLVNAGPGTGKTRTLVARIQHLLSIGYQPEQILALTFSNRAATEMRLKVRRSEPVAGASVTVTTFHGFCLELLRRYHDRVGLPVDFTIIDDIDAVALLERNIQALPLAESRMFKGPGDVLHHIVSTISRAKDELITPEAYRALLENAEANGADPDDVSRWREVADVYPIYEQLLLKLGVTDYGGLISQCVALLQGEPEVLEKLRSEYRHVLVDEYQDMNRASSHLLRLLVGEGAGLWVVGDLRQSIYRFRGASAQNILNFETDFPGAFTLPLNVNYRSDAAIVELVGVASRLPQGVDTSQQWKAYRGGSESPRITVAKGSSPSSEALGIAAAIKDRLEQGRQYRDHAVLVTKHAHAQLISEILTREGIPVCYLGDLFARPEIRAALCFLQLTSTSNIASLLGVCEFDEFRMPREDRLRLISYARRHELSAREAIENSEAAGISRSESLNACQRIVEAMQEAGFAVSPWILLSRFLFGRHSPVRRLQGASSVAASQQLFAFSQLLAIAKTFADRPMSQGVEPLRVVPEFMAFIRRLVANGKHIASTPEAMLELDAVQVMTVHAAKGLEFPCVFVTQLADGQFPGKEQNKGIPPIPGMISGDQSSDDEALFFVAVSRAEDELVLSWSGASERGKPVFPSPFLNVIDELPQHVRVNHVLWEQDDASDDLAISRPVQQPLVVPLKLVPRNLENHKDCPRKFEYDSVLRLNGQFEPLPHHVFKRSTFSAWKWAKTQLDVGELPGSKEILARTIEFWAEEFPEAPLLNSKFSDSAIAIAELLSDLLRTSSSSLIENSAAFYKTPQITYDPQIHHLYRDVDDQVIGVKFVFGRDRKDHVDPALAVARRALQEHVGDSITIKLEILDLVSGHVEEVPEANRWEPDRIQKVEKAVAAIESGEFPATPAVYNCRRCLFWAICPA